MRKLSLSAPCFFVATSMLTPAVHAAIMIDVGSHVLLPDTPRQSISLFVSGDEPVEGLNLLVQLGATLGNTIELAPAITAADVISGTIFSSNNLGQFDAGSQSQLASVQTLTVSGTVLPVGKLVTLTIDTTGFESGSWPLLLTRTIGGDTDFAGVPASITNGQLTVAIPEPAQTLSVLGFATGLMIRRRRLPY